MMRRVLAIPTLFVVVCCGCERATRQIERDQARIESLARSTIVEIEQSIEEIRLATETGQVGPTARPHLDESIHHQRRAVSHQNSITAAADRTRSRLVHVEDKVHPLVRLAQTWGTVALIAAVMALLAYLGVGPLIRRGFQMIGLRIPRAVRQDAKFDAEAIATGSAGSHDRERIAARRSADHAYDRAFSRCKRARRREAQTPGHVRAQTNGSNENRRAQETRALNPRSDAERK